MRDDFIKKADKANEDNKIARAATASKYHRVFEQNIDGKQIFSSWVQRFCMTPIANPDPSAFEAGVNEGKRLVVNEILKHLTYINQLGDKNE